MLDESQMKSRFQWIQLHKAPHSDCSKLETRETRESAWDRPLYSVQYRIQLHKENRCFAGKSNSKLNLKMKTRIKLGYSVSAKPMNHRWYRGFSRESGTKSHSPLYSNRERNVAKRWPNRLNSSGISIDCDLQSTNHNGLQIIKHTLILQFSLSVFKSYVDTSHSDEFSNEQYVVMPGMLGL